MSERFVYTVVMGSLSFFYFSLFHSILFSLSFHFHLLSLNLNWMEIKNEMRERVEERENLNDGNEIKRVNERRQKQIKERERRRERNRERNGNKINEWIKWFMNNKWLWLWSNRRLAKLDTICMISLWHQREYNIYIYIWIYILLYR